MQALNSKRAISTLIATVMLIAVAVAASLLTYVFVMNYVDGTTAKVEEGIEIQSISQANEGLSIYVQNIGRVAVNFNPTSSVYINSVLKTCTMPTTPIQRGETVTMTLNDFAAQRPLTVKVTTTDGIAAEKTFT